VSLKGEGNNQFYTEGEGTDKNGKAEKNGRGTFERQGGHIYLDCKKKRILIDAKRGRRVFPPKKRERIGFSGNTVVLLKKKKDRFKKKKKKKTTTEKEEKEEGNPKRKRFAEITVLPRRATNPWPPRVKENKGVPQWEEERSTSTRKKERHVIREGGNKKLMDGVTVPSSGKWGKKE